MSAPERGAAAGAAPAAAGSERTAPIAIGTDEFRALGHWLVDEIARRLAAIPQGKVAPGVSATVLRDALDAAAPLPERGTDPAALLERTSRLLFEYSLLNGHPRFFGYITSSPAPIGILGDFLAAAVNANGGAWTLAPAGTEIELQAVRWIAELIGFPVTCGGIMVSGGNMANMIGFFAARAAVAPWDVRAEGMDHEGKKLRVYASGETHTWIQKAADLAGLGTQSVRWIATDARQRMDLGALAAAIDADVARGDVPMMVVGTAGSVSTGAIDPLPGIGALCRERGIWFHVDGAYGGFAAALPEAPADLRALAGADSVAIDPHKWLYAPLEAGCALVRDPDKLFAAFSYHPPYYHLEEQLVNFVDYGPQNSRGFRALKVWLAIQHVGAEGYRRMIRDDIALAGVVADAVKEHPEFEMGSLELSIATFRYVPPDLRARVGEDAVERHLDALNRALLDRSQRAGEVFVSNAVTAGRYLLRACIVNFHTTAADARAVPALLAPLARRIDAELRLSSRLT